MRTPLPHPEVAETPRTLAGTSLRLVALTNSTAEVAHPQLIHAHVAVDERLGATLADEERV